MVDYKPLLREAIQAQDNHSQAGRAALYERARAAQSKTFQASDPPLTKAEMASRRKELQTAIYEIEREFPDGFTAKQPLQGKRGDKQRFEDFDPIAALIGSELNGHGQGAGTSVAVPSTPPRPSKPIANSADYSDDLIAELAALMGGAPTASPTETSKVIRIPGMNPAPPTEATPVTKFDFAAKPAIATPIKSEPLSTLVGRLGSPGPHPRCRAAKPRPLSLSPPPSNRRWRNRHQKDSISSRLYSRCRRPVSSRTTSR